MASTFFEHRQEIVNARECYKDPFAAECNQYARKFDDAFNAKDWVTTEHLIAESEEL